MSDVIDFPELQERKRVVIPYYPRKHFLPLHNSTKRWQFVCAHRRAGKTVCEFNHLLRAANNNKRQEPFPRYGYVGPSFDQVKDLVWGYAKQYAGGIPGVKFYEGDLMCVLPNSATIRLYGGAAAYERMRGLYFDGIVLDEFPLLNPTVFSSVVRPCLADYLGFAIVSGTSNGDDHFHDLLKKNEKNPNWDIHIIPVTQTDALKPSEVEEMTSDMSAEEYAREMLCSFDAPIEGAYYADALNKMSLTGRITKVPHDSAAQVITCWDLGIHDSTCIWFFQVVGREVHWIDYYQNQGVGLEHYALMLSGRQAKHGYKYKAHLLPHDVEARELGTGQSRRMMLMNLLNENVIAVPASSVEDGINATRGILGISWIDEERCKEGLSCLRSYSKNRNGNPIHNWASHGADSMRTGTCGFNLVTTYSGRYSATGPLKKKIRGRI